MLKKVQTMMPDGTIPVGIGLGLLGLCVYVFQSLATIAFGQESYAPFGAMWLLTFVVVPGLFLPIEQELARALAARNARGEGSGPLIRKAATLAFALLFVSVTITFIFGPLIVNTLFKGNWSLLYSFVFALIGYVFAYIVRGTLAGKGRFGSYGVLLGLEGVIRASLAGLLLVFHYDNYLAWGVLVGLAPLMAAMVCLWRERNLNEDGPDASYAELSASLGWLLLGQLFAQALLNAAPLFVQGSAHTTEQHKLSSTFTFAIFISRVPLFMFQAVQAALLPRLAHLATGNHREAFQKLLNRMLLLVVGIGIIATLTSWLIGPWVVEKMSSEGFTISHRDIGLLALGNSIFMLALALAQALIALSKLSKVAQSWVLGLVTFVIVVLSVSGFYLRAELALCLGSTAAMVAMYLFLQRALAQESEPDVNALIEAVAPYNEVIEP